MDWAKKLTLPENLHWAWNKAKSIYRAGDSWFDEMEVARFEANLDAELDGIAHDFGRLEYRVSPLRPLPHPKKPSGPKEKPVRPMFLIGIRDQVAWIALVNLMGPTIDEQMPPWSYGNRLHRSVWYEDIDDRRTFRRGPYRNTANRLYRVFRQSWPLYRRHLSLTVRKMASIRDLPDDKAELQVLLAEESLAENNPARLPYLLPNWWNHPSANVYRAHIDLKRFYPSIRLEVILENLAAYHPSLPIEFS